MPEEGSISIEQLLLTRLSKSDKAKPAEKEIIFSSAGNLFFTNWDLSVFIHHDFWVSTITPILTHKNKIFICNNTIATL